MMLLLGGTMGSYEDMYGTSRPSRSDRADQADYDDEMMMYEDEGELYLDAYGSHSFGHGTEF